MTVTYDFKVGEYGRIEKDDPGQTWQEWTERYRDSLLYHGGGPFEGLTIGKAFLIDHALFGYPVRVKTVNDHERRRGGTFGIFKGIQLPGGWGTDPLAHVGDLRVQTEYPDEAMFEREYVGGGSYRVMSPAAVIEFDVIAPDPWIECWHCGRYRPRHRLRHQWRWIEDWTPNDLACMDTFEWVCRGASEEGYCS